MSSTQGTTVNQAHNVQGPIASILGVIGTLGTADVNGTALTLPFGVDPNTGAIFTNNIGGASGYLEGTTVGTMTGNAIIFRGTGGTTVAVGTQYPLPVQEQFAPNYEDNTGSVAATIFRPLNSSQYTPSDFTSFGAAAGTGAVVKASAGNVYSLVATNGGTNVRYIQLFNSTTAAVNGGTPVACYVLPGASTAVPYVLPLDNTHFSPSKYFSTGIAVAISSTNGTLGTANVIAADHNIAIKYV